MPSKQDTRANQSRKSIAVVDPRCVSSRSSGKPVQFTLDATAGDIIAMVSAAIAAHLIPYVQAAISPVGGEYLSSGPLPPGIGRARFNRVAKTVVGAEKDGRVWRVSRSAWDAHRSRPVSIAPGSTAADDEADGLLAGAGLRASLRIVRGDRR